MPDCIDEAMEADFDRRLEEERVSHSPRPKQNRPPPTTIPSGGISRMPPYYRSTEIGKHRMLHELITDEDPYRAGPDRELKRLELALRDQTDRRCKAEDRQAMAFWVGMLIGLVGAIFCACCAFYGHRPPYQ